METVAARPRLASRVDAAIRDGSLASNDAVRFVLGRARELGGRLHLIGLISDASDHACLHHLHALIELAQAAKVRVVVHALLDGVDAGPRTAPRFVAGLEARLVGGVGRVGTVAGRLWGMDAHGRWDRIQRSYRAILAADVQRVDTALRGIELSHESGRSDDLVEPFVVFDYPGVSPVDTAIHFNLLGEGGRELTQALASPAFHGFVRKGGRAPFAARFACMTTFDASLSLPVLFADGS